MIDKRIFPPLLDENRLDFPDLYEAIAYRDGLVAIGGDLSYERLLVAYSLGVFPWYNKKDPICWWALSPRMVLYPQELYIGRSLKKSIRSQSYCIKVNCAFERVVACCAQKKRKGQNGTWIHAEIEDAYRQMHLHGNAHSFEYWQNDQLLGGVYGVQIGRVFFGESMFALVDNASKIAFVHAVEFLRSSGVALIDCQMYTDHLARFGANEIEFSVFEQQLAINSTLPLLQPITSGILYDNIL